MSLFEKSQVFIQKGNLSEALDFLIESYKTENNSREINKQICYEVKNLSHTLGKYHEEYIHKFLAQAFFSNECFEEAIIEAELLLVLQENKSNFKLTIESARLSGNVDKFRKYLDKYLYFLLKRKDIEVLNSTLLDFSDLLQASDRRLWEIRASVLTGNVKKIEELLDQSDENEQVLIEFNNITSHQTSYWHSSKVVKNWLIEELVKTEKTKEISKKSVVKLLIDVFIEGDIGVAYLEKCLQIAHKWHISSFGYELSNYLRDEESADKFLVNIPREMMIGEKFDFGSDLLSKKESLEERSEEDLVNELKFVMSLNNKEAVARVRRVIEEQYPDSEVLKIDNKTSSIADTLDEIRKYSKFDGQSDAKIEDLVDYYEDKYLFEHYDDLITSYNMMGQFESSLKIINRIKQYALELVEDINILYLEAETLVQAKQYFKARDLIEDLLCSKVLVHEEKLTFSYLRAECYYHLKDYKQAKRIFYAIKRMKDNYRLTEQRLRYIEKS